MSFFLKALLGFFLTSAIPAFAAPLTLHGDSYVREHPQFKNVWNAHINSNMLSCSGVKISPKGYVLTSMSCLSWNCQVRLVDSGHLHRKSVSGLEVWEISNQTPNLNCEIYSRHEGGGSQGQEMPVTIKFLGKGMINQDLSYSEIENLARIPSLIKDYAEDYVIYEVPNSGEIGAMPSVKTSLKPVRLKEQVWSIGWPDEFGIGRACKNTNPIESASSIFRISSGSVYSELTPEMLPGGVEDGNVEPYRKWQKDFNKAFPETYIRHTAATCPGMSGGALVNADGSLVGINSLGAVYHDWSIGGSSISVLAIKKSIEAAGLDASDFFDWSE